MFDNCLNKQEVSLEIDNVTLERVYCIKFLGVSGDHKLCWKPNIKYVFLKVSKSIGILAKTKNSSEITFNALPHTY